jgi:uncharacterized protein (TIGR02246 family)
MKCSSLLILLVVILTTPLAAQEPDGKPPASTAATEDAPESEDVVAIRKAIDSYVAAFNDRDAKKLAAHFTERGEMFTPDGGRIQGRAEIEKDFSVNFENAKQGKLEVLAVEVDVLSPTVAVETGTARVIASDAEPSDTRYKAVHVKTTEGWKLDSVREQEAPAAAPSHFENLQDLQWMIGRWSDTSDVANIESSCRWTTNRNFIVQSFKVYVDDRVDFEGTQVIGWDPALQTIRSWMFDSDGGFGAGRWSNDGARWTVQTLNVLPDGRRGSSTNIYEVIDGDTVRYRSIGRQVEGELLPSVGPVTLVRAAQE